MQNQTELEILMCVAGLKKVPQRYVLHILNIFQLSREGECAHEGEEQKQILWPVGPPLSACSCQRFAVSHGCVRNVSMCQHSFRISDDKLQFAGEQLVICSHDEAPASTPKWSSTQEI